MGKVDCRKYVEITRIENALGPARKKLMEQGRMNQSKAPVEDQKFQTQTYINRIDGQQFKLSFWPAILEFCVKNGTANLADTKG